MCRCINPNSRLKSYYDRHPKSNSIFFFFCSFVTGVCDHSQILLLTTLMYGSINLYFQMSGEHYHPPHIPPVFLYITFRVPFDYKTGSFKLTNQTHKHHIHHTIKRKIFFFSFVGCVIWYIVQLYDGIYRDSDSDILFMFFFLQCHGNQ